MSCCCVVVISTLLLTCFVSHTVAVTRPDQVRFCVYWNMDDATLQYAGVQEFVGLKAAELAANTGNTLRGMNVTFEYLPAPPLNATPAMKAEAAAAAAANTSCFGFILADWTSSPALFDAIDQHQGSSVPVIAPHSVLNSPYVPTRNNLIHARPPLSAEYLLMVHHAVHMEGVQCRNFHLVIGSLFNASEIVEGVTSALRYLGLPDPRGVVAVAEDGSGAIDAKAAANGWAAIESVEPCGLLFLQGAEVLSLLEEFYADLRIANTTYYFAHGLSVVPSYIAPTKGTGTAPYANLRVVQAYLDATDVTVPSSAAYQAAVGRLFAQHPASSASSWLPTEMTRVAIDIVPNYYALEGYMMGMLLLDMLSATLELTRANLLATIYERRMFSVNETIVSPFTNGCLDRSVASLPCYCNSGGIVMYISLVDNSSKRLMTLIMNPHELAELTVNPHECSFLPSQLPRPATIVLVTPPVLPAAADVTFINTFSQAIRATNEFIEDAGDITKFVLTMMLRADYNASRGSEYATLLRQAKNVIAMTGTYIDATVPYDVPLLISGSAFPLSNPPLRKATAYSHYTLEVTANLPDSIHGAVAYAAHLFPDEKPPTALVADSQQVFDLLLLSMHTFQFNPEMQTPSLSYDGMDYYIQWAMREAEVGPALVVASTANDTTALRFLDRLAVLTTNASATVLRNLLVLIPWNTAFTNAARLSTTLTPFESDIRLFFQSVIPPYWVNTSRLYIGMKAVFGDDPLYLGSPTAERGYVISKFIATVLRNMPSYVEVTRDSFIAAVYEQGTVTFDGLSYGPFYSANCSDDIIKAQRADRLCQCNKGYKDSYPVHFLDFKGGTWNRNANFFYHFSTCGPDLSRTLPP